MTKDQSWKIQSNKWKCLTLWFINGHAKINGYWKLSSFKLEWLLSLSVIVFILVIWTMYSMIVPVNIAHSTTLFSILLTFDLVPLHNSLTWLIFLINIIRILTFTHNLWKKSKTIYSILDLVKKASNSFTTFSSSFILKKIPWYKLNFFENWYKLNLANYKCISKYLEYLNF
jgi:hypothetical protein